MIKTVFVCGPTAAGKTEYAIRLAQDLNGEIVSADSMQIYKYMDIGSAKPTKEERARAVHHMVDEIDPSEPFSAAEYRIKAMEYIRLIYDGGKLPIVCGGTGLYVNSLIYDMDFSGPAGSDEYRQNILKEEDSDPERLYARLRKLDPKAADEIHPNNIKRVLRAIERLEKGESELASFAGLTKKNEEICPILIGITRDREELYRRIDKRVDLLIEAGLEDEVKKLMSMGFTSDDIAMKGIGYKEIIDAVNDGHDALYASDTIKLNTRHYAKRQLTWFRRYKEMVWYCFDGTENDENVYGSLLKDVKEKLNG